jgi:hypothetical protein
MHRVANLNTIPKNFKEAKVDTSFKERFYKIMDDNPK